MTNFFIDGIEYHLIDCWEEMTLDVFLRITKILENHSKSPLDDETLTTGLIEALSRQGIGQLDDISLKLALELEPKILFAIDHTKIVPSGKTEWDIDGVIYSYYTDTNDYNLSDVSDIKQYMTIAPDKSDYLAKIASVLIRPFTKITSEAGITYNKLIKRSKIDMNHIENMVCTRIPVGDVIEVLNFFLTGMLKPQTSLKGSLPNEKTPVQP